ncbi:MAG: prepilin-type N-terminal cleavage/methylation domain-containing protein [Spirochaetales bacterium]|nr:prepilin-type N-terminal cleavage/methylation domain-containing protein [Spirochaetales bacterium]
MTEEKGMSLIEVMIAMVILAIGIQAAMAMQIMATAYNVKSLKLTNANNVALSLMEILKELPFEDYALTDTGDLVHNDTDRTFDASGLTILQNLSLTNLQNLIGVSTGADPGTIVDQSGITYQLSWDVQDNTVDKTIRVYMAVDSFMSGQSQLDMTSVKYNNISLNP